MSDVVIDSTSPGDDDLRVGHIEIDEAAAEVLAETEAIVDQAAEAPSPELHYRTCPLCEATCGLEIAIIAKPDGTREIGRIRGDREDVFRHGFICPKGSTLKQLHEDPDRLRQPVIRRGDDLATATWETVSWDEAFAEIERRLLPIIETHGRDAVAIYLGNPNVHNLAGTLYGRAVIKAVGTQNLFSASTVDQMPKHVSSGLMFGSADTIPVPDLDRTDYLLMLGANPYESNGSLCTAPDFPGRLEAIQARGGRVVVVDPRRTKTAKQADEHLFIRPGTDAHFLLAIINVLFRDGLADLGRLGEHTNGVDAVRVAAEPFSPAVVGPITGIDAATIERIARELAAAPTAAVYGRIGTHTVEFGTIASWAVDAINVLTGNLDRPGGAMFPLAAHSRVGKVGPGRGFATGKYTSRVKGFPEVRREFPVAALADEITTPGEGQVRAVITVGGNPALSTPNSDKLDAAFAGLDFMVCVDPYRNETTRHADVILPPPAPLARSHYDLAFYTLAVRNVANYSPPILEADGLQESEILARLALVISGAGATADPAIIDDMMLDGVLQRVVAEGGPLAGHDPAVLVGKLLATAPTDRIVEVMIRTGAYGDQFGLDPDGDPDGLTLAKLIEFPHGIDLGPLQPRVPEVLSTPTGRIEVAPEPIIDDLGRMVDSLDRHRNGDLVLVGRRHVRSNNSWMHNLGVLVKGKDRCTLQVNPADAERLGLHTGGSATVASRVGKLIAPVEVTDEVMAGVVSLPHGWGHDREGTQMGVATDHAGVNSNILTDEEAIDPLSGNAVLNAIPVTVSPA